MIERFTHESRPDEKRYVTVCFLLGNSEALPVAGGISICCPLDQYNKKRGNGIARGRAYKALALKKSFNPVSPEHQKFASHLYKAMYYDGSYPIPQ